MQETEPAIMSGKKKKSKSRAESAEGKGKKVKKQKKDIDHTADEEVADAPVPSVEDDDVGNESDSMEVSDKKADKPDAPPDQPAAMVEPPAPAPIKSTNPLNPLAEMRKKLAMNTADPNAQVGTKITLAPTTYVNGSEMSLPSAIMCVLECREFVNGTDKWYVPQFPKFGSHATRRCSRFLRQRWQQHARVRARVSGVLRQRPHPADAISAQEARSCAKFARCSQAAMALSFSVGGLASFVSLSSLHRRIRPTRKLSGDAHLLVRLDRIEWTVQGREKQGDNKPIGNVMYMDVGKLTILAVDREPQVFEETATGIDKLAWL